MSRDVTRITQEKGKTMLKATRRVLAVGFASAVLMSGGVTSASALTSYLANGEGYASAPSTRTSYSAKDTKADGYRVYGEFWLNNDTYQQLITTSYNQTVTQTLSGGVRVSSLRACLDVPIGLDGCASKKFF